MWQIQWGFSIHMNITGEYRFTNEEHKCTNSNTASICIKSRDLQLYTVVLETFSERKKIIIYSSRTKKLQIFPNPSP